MKFNKTKTNSMSCPWVESDFARSILNNKKINKDVKRKALFYINNGYVIYRNALSLNIINNTVKDFYKILNSNYLFLQFLIGCYVIDYNQTLLKN